MNNKEYMNIVIGSSRENSIFATVLLKSLFENNQGEKFNIYLYYDESMDNELYLLKNMIEKYGNIFHPMFVSEERKKDCTTNQPWWHPALWYRYYCLEDLWHENDRALLLGTDVIVQKNIKDFYFSDMNGKGITAITDMGHYYDTYRSEDCLKRAIPKEEYINPDILLFDLKKLNGLINVKDMVDLCADNKLWALDQDTLNFFYHDLIFVNHDMRYHFIPATVYEIMEKNEYNQKLNEAVFIHYAVKKPWNEYTPDCSHDLWFEYAKKTDCYDKIREYALESSWKKISYDNDIKAKLRKHILKMDKLFYIIDLLWDACENGTLIQNLSKENIRNIAIYGYGKLGKHLLKYCKNNNITVSYLIDSVKDGKIDGIPIIKPENICEQPIVDAIVVTPIQDFEEIRLKIGNPGYRIISLEQIIK